MTSNQHHAIELARGIVERRIAPSSLSDLQWVLLLLAAGLKGVQSPPTIVSYLVLQNARSNDGYFAPDELAATGHAHAA